MNFLRNKWEYLSSESINKHLHFNRQKWEWDIWNRNDNERTWNFRNKNFQVAQFDTTTKTRKILAITKNWH